MTDHSDHLGNRADDMTQYLQTFLDETEEQLDDLVETMLALEQESTNKEDLNEAFRLIHSIKGSAGMMGFDNITVLTHHLENRFERFRSGTEQLDEPTMNLVLRCIDFLRQCNDRLRNGEQSSSATELLEELKRLETQAQTSATDRPEQSAAESPAPDTKATDSPTPTALDEHNVGDAIIRLAVRFRTGLQLSDLKAQLIVARLSGLGEVRSTQPDVEQLSEVEQLEQLHIDMQTHETLDRLRAAADVDGVESIEFPGAVVGTATQTAIEETTDIAPSDTHDATPSPSSYEEATASEAHGTDDLAIASEMASSFEQHVVADKSEDRPTEPATAVQQRTEVAEPAASEKPNTKVAETMRVDIDRLDNLMNLAGELVVNRARFIQISGQIDPALRKATMLNRIRDFSEGLRRTIESLEDAGEDVSDRSTQIQQLRAGLELMNEQSEIWENGRYCFGQISEAIDQLSRVSHRLQRGVLDTRMVPVGPLFNRFKRVVRDLSKERGKRVDLQILGENTELDKRMIDELSDPLVHLVRNSIDHGIEPPDVRVGRGKPEVGTIYLEANHSGNNIYIRVRDDGGGINVENIKAKLIEKSILSEPAVDELSDEQALEYIWHPGFSTAREVTDVSGRGVGMDVVKTRIGLLNGTIDVESTPQRGTTFALRLPLTLAIIDCMLVRLRNVMFSMPIDDVREIVSVKERDIITVQGKQTIDVRGKFLPLISIDDVFHWHGVDYSYSRPGEPDPSDVGGKTVEVVILHFAGNAMGLRVDELLGSQDIVIKSLSDNLMDIRGLSGASILGDGSVCLMLDVGTVIDMARRRLHTAEVEEVAT